MEMKQINEVLMVWGPAVKYSLPNLAERQPALSYSHCSLLLLAVC